jgi:predicted Fe-Mo cluster-binding NifX family protein
MAEEIADCDILIAGGMGMGAYENFKSTGLEVIMTDESVILEAVQKYLAGNLINLKQQRTH